MGLAERSYYKESSGRNGRGGGRFGGYRSGRVSFTTMLIVSNIAIFLVPIILALMLKAPIPGWLVRYGHFSTDQLIGHLEFWRLITFQFLHASIEHVLLNMFGLWVFGRMVEEYLGFKRYAAFYLVCGIAGAVMYMLLNLGGAIALKAGYSQVPIVIYNSTNTPLVGASAGVYGVIMAAAFIAPNAVMQLIFPPIPIRIRTLAYAYVAMAIGMVIFGAQNAGGEAAHIGGAIAGFFFIRNSHLLHDFFDIFGDSRKTKKPRPSRRLDQEVDRILGKVSTQGLHSLTDREKRTMEEAARKSQRAG